MKSFNPATATPSRGIKAADASSPPRSSHPADNAHQIKLRIAERLLIMQAMRQKFPDLS